MSPKIIKLAQDVLNIEANEILKASDKISNEFSDAVECILRCEGRVILSGIGKSGHIAGKIASTLSSTGTPSFFMHPGEASHGDLGMIGPQDLCLLISNSGETAELKDMIAHKVEKIGMLQKNECQSDLLLTLLQNLLRLMHWVLLRQYL